MIDKKMENSQFGNCTLCMAAELEWNVLRDFIIVQHLL